MINGSSDPSSSSSKDPSSEVIEESDNAVTSSPSTHRKKSRSKKTDKHSSSSSKSAAMRIPSSFRGIIPTKCVLQRVQLHHSGRIYVTEDLYGMDKNQGGKSEPNDQREEEDGEGGGGQLVDNDSPDCVICLTDPKEVAVYPCRHMCMCVTCAEALPSQNNKCPMCRRPALLLLRYPVLYLCLCLFPTLHHALTHRSLVADSPGAVTHQTERQMRARSQSNKKTLKWGLSDSH
jgi:hypothetical protein